MIGRTVLGTWGRSLGISVDNRPLYKAGGITFDWTTVAAVGVDTTWLNGVFLSAARGDKGLRYGQVVCQITASGLYGPYDPAAADGRQLLVNGKCFLLNRAAIFGEPLDDFGEAIYGGLVYAARLIQSGTAAHSLAAGPTLAELLAAFPQLELHYV